jgi:hypothetical protein
MPTRDSHGACHFLVDGPRRYARTAEYQALVASIDREIEQELRERMLLAGPLGRLWWRGVRFWERRRRLRQRLPSTESLWIARTRQHWRHDGLWREE